MVEYRVLDPADVTGALNEGVVRACRIATELPREDLPDFLVLVCVTVIGNNVAPSGVNHAMADLVLRILERREQAMAVSERVDMLLGKVAGNG